MIHLLLQVVQVHQGTVDSYLENVIMESVDNTADVQARAEIYDLATKINNVAYDMEDKWVLATLVQKSLWLVDYK